MNPAVCTGGGGISNASGSKTGWTKGGNDKGKDQRRRSIEERNIEREEDVKRKKARGQQIKVNSHLGESRTRVYR